MSAGLPRWQDVLGHAHPADAGGRPEWYQLAGTAVPQPPPAKAPEAATPPLQLAAECPCECHGRTLDGLHGCCANSVPEERDALAAERDEAKAHARRDQEMFLTVSKAFEDERDEARAAVREICARLRDKGLLELLDLVPGWLERAGLDPSILEAPDAGR